MYSPPSKHQQRLERYVSFSYVHILESLPDPQRHYTGLTDDLESRLKKHNEGSVPHTANHLPWKIRVAIAFPSRDQAAQFEAYLKSHSGRAFAKRHF